MSITAIISATIVRRSTASVHDKIAPLTYVLLLFGLFWWYAGGIGQFVFYARRSDRLALLLRFVTISRVLGEGYGTLVLAVYCRRWRHAALPTPQVALVDRGCQWVTWGMSFGVLNTAIARAFHHLNSVPFTFTALYNSAIVQTTFFWRLWALTLMYLAHHRHWRHVWLIGATLLSITIIKLFLVDLANTGSLARIVSFIGVGLFTIIVAYFWPAPPRTLHRPQADPV